MVIPIDNNNIKSGTGFVLINASFGMIMPFKRSIHGI
jgi:hypothetical protein